MSKIYKYFSALLLMVALALAFPLQAFAVNPLDPTKSATLTLTSEHEGQVIPGMIVNIYRIATINNDGTFTKTEGFKDYPVEINGLDSAGLASLATTLRGYVARDAVIPDGSGITDDKGVVSFPQPKETLKHGLYLVVGLQTKVETNAGTNVYTPTPFILSVPTIPAGASDWEYNVAANQKLFKETNPSSTPKTIKVIKEWKDKGYETSRPDSVTIDLLKDGKVFDTVKLNEGNKWAFTWENLDASSDWLVVERDISGYTISIAQQNNAFVVTNTKTPPGTPPGTPPSEKLPQTGVLWWPVPVLAVLGLVCLFIGIVLSRRKKHGA